MRNQHGKSAAAATKTLIWIDDYAPGLAVYKAVFESFGYRVLTESDARRGLSLLQRNAADAVVVDYEMPGMDGEAVAAEVRRKNPLLPIVMFSGCASIPSRVKQIITAFCEKTGSLDHLRSAIDQAVQATA